MVKESEGGRKRVREEIDTEMREGIWGYIC